MDPMLGLTAGAPASALLLATILAVSLLGLYKVPALIDKNLLRPHGLVQRGEYATLVTSGFIHADLAHLLFNSFTFWALACDSDLSDPWQPGLWSALEMFRDQNLVGCGSSALARVMCRGRRGNARPPAPSCHQQPQHHQ